MKWILIFSLLAQLNSKISSLEVFCSFKEFPEFNLDYGCEVQNLKIISIDDRNISKALGLHIDQKNDESVKVFSSYQKILKFFPRNLTKIFKFLEILSIQSGNLQEISSNDLESFGGNLKILNLFGNSIEGLESEIFQFNPNLEKIDLGGNKIKHIGDETFNRLQKLKELKFEGNSCHSGYAANSESLKKLFGFIKSFCKNDNFVIKIEIKKLREEIENVKRILGNFECKILEI